MKFLTLPYFILDESAENATNLVVRIRKTGVDGGRRRLFLRNPYPLVLFHGQSFVELAS